MIGLYLLAAHLAGDFLLQDRWQAAGKFADWRLRTGHVAGYCVPFVPLAIWRAGTWRAALTFMAALFVLHFATDSHRFQSTVGDVARWTIDRRVAPGAAIRAWIDHLYGADAPGDFALEARIAKSRQLTEGGIPRLPPPNPWPGMPLMIDQALHVCQVALLGGIFLS